MTEILLFFVFPEVLVDKEQGKVVFLTAKEIESCELAKQKLGIPTMKMYYNCDIIFKDGKRSCVRMSKEKCNAVFTALIPQKRT